MKKLSLIISSFLLSLAISSFAYESIDAQQAEQLKNEFLQTVEKIDSNVGAEWPIQHNGRLKPFQSLARETSLYLTGKYSFWGVSPTAFYLGLMIYPKAEELQIIEMRFPDLREKLGFARDKRYFSVKELRESQLMQLAGPLQSKQQKNKRNLTELENKTLESVQQFFLAQELFQGGQILMGVDPKLSDPNHGKEGTSIDPEIQNTFLAFMDSLKSGLVEAQKTEAEKVMQVILKQRPTENKEELNSKISRELFYNKFQPFMWAAWISLLLSVLLWIQGTKKIFTHKILVLLCAIPMLIEILGFTIRIGITGFAPVTNMFGTMLWVGFGIGLFSLLLFSIYKNVYLASMLNFGVFLILLLTHSIPLVLSPDMDPIVAVLRSNFWLTIHVLTITISYASFSIAMLIGNTAIVRYLLGKADAQFIKTYSHFAYRSIQLGVFLLSVGIILGGVWADYSWGRFWGWDPKETWALIADLGFLVLLHARYIQWISPFGLMIFSPIAYLLVIMAWYGVNFILAAGLHSYGFSSGGAKMVLTFVIIQLTLFLMAFIKSKIKSELKT